MRLGQKLGRYHLVEVLGSGAFGSVFLAEDPALDDLVAIKVLAENWSLDADIRARFINEARLARRVESDHLVRVHDIGETSDGRPYYVMDYVAGGTLDALIRDADDRPLTVPLVQAMVVARSIAAGLHDLHQAGIVHRDIKPSNLLIRRGRQAQPAAGQILAPGDRILVSDYSLAKDLMRGSRLTIAAGTPGYMAPEQRTGERIDVRADIYAAAAVVVRLLTGSAPTMDRSWKRPTGNRADLTSVLERALSFEPEDRQPDVDTWIDELEAAARPEPPTDVDLRVSLPCWTRLAGPSAPRSAPAPKPTAARWSGPSPSTRRSCARRATNVSDGVSPIHRVRASGSDRRRRHRRGG